MSTFIQLTALQKNGSPFTKVILVDVNMIALPIVENLAGNSIVEVDTNISYGAEHFGSREKFEVDESLAAIDLLTDEVFLGTILTKNNRPDQFPEALFVKSRVIGIVEEESPGGNSIFGYRVMANRSPEVYVVSETLAAINA